MQESTIAQATLVASSPGRRWAPWAPVGALFVVLLAGLPLQAQIGAFDPPWLLTTLNLAFLTIVPAGAAVLAVVGYRRTGVFAVLALGAAMLATAVGAGVLPGLLLFRDRNDTLTLHNVAILAAGACHLVAAVAGVLGLSLGRRRRTHVGLAYVAVAVGIAAWLLLIVADATPAFWTADGTTPLRQAILAVAAALYGLSAFAWWQTAVRDRGIRFLSWYVPGLALFTVGIVGLLLQTVVGGVVGWTARVAQYLGAVYMLVAVAREILPLGAPRAESKLGVSLLQAALPFRPLVESTSDAVFALGRSGRVVYWNEAARQMFGWAPDEAFDRDPIDLLAGPDEAPDVRRALGSVLASPSADVPAGRRQVVLSTRNGDRFPAEILAFASPEDDRLVVCVISDVSARVRAHEELEARVRERTAELEQLNDELARANAAKDEFLGLVSHELKTPITTILAATTLLERRRSEADGELVHDLVAEAARLAGIIDNLLALARLDAGQPGDREPVALDRLAAATAAAVEREHHGRSISVEAEAGVIVEANEAQLAMVIRNYLVNATKYSPDDAPIELVLETTEQTARLAIRDRGPGLPDGDPMTLFEPFQRGAAAARAPGIGIGLTVCRRVIESHDGTVGAAQRADRPGAVFWFELPLAGIEEGDAGTARRSEGDALAVPAG